MKNLLSIGGGNHSEIDSKGKFCTLNNLHLTVFSHPNISNGEQKTAPFKPVTMLRRGSSHSLFTLDEEEESKKTSGKDQFIDHSVVLGGRSIQ